jgi:tRNA pseudouridine38-40 synthase
MRNIKLTIEYDGKDFNGWQKQPNKLNIQGEIERAIEEVTGEKVDLIASGRTDAGVHALAQVANFKIQNMSIPVEKIPYALNSKLKKSIRIQSAEEVDDKFHSRYACKKKTYRYTINNSEQGTAIYRNMQYHYPNKLDAQKMNEGAKYLIGEHDFKSFKASGTSSKSSVRTIYNAEVTQTGNQITIELTGNGFLYNMVRIIAGTLVEVGEGKIKPSDVKRILEAQDRLQAGKTLPANGLMLINVEYEEN